MGQSYPFVTCGPGSEWQVELIELMTIPLLPSPCDLPDQEALVISRGARLVQPTLTWHERAHFSCRASADPF
jgi:hypothetical protein